MAELRSHWKVYVDMSQNKEPFQKYTQKQVPEEEKSYTFSSHLDLLSEIKQNTLR